MQNRLSNWLSEKLAQIMMKESKPEGAPLSDYERLRYEIRPGDVLLVEGHSHVSNVIRTITQSPWTHALLYIGRLHDIEDPIVRRRVRDAYQGEESDQLVIESLLGKGTIVTPLRRYQTSHLRICRPEGLSRLDAERVIAHASLSIGQAYDVRQIFDLARLLLPWSIFPRRWRSSLFRHNAGEHTRSICSSLIAEAFGSVQFPILPIIRRDKDLGLQYMHRNPRLFTPRDFDYSPYFNIIKYPFYEVNDNPVYRQLPWADGQYVNDDGSEAGKTPGSLPHDE